jgi:predicted metal-dependent hydrolase
MRFALFRRTPLTDPAHLDVRFADASFKIALRRRPQARRITLRVSSATGEVVLTLPQRTDLATAQRFANAHGDWIATRLANVPQRITFEHGAMVPFRGIPHRIVHWSKVGGLTEATVDARGRPVIAVSCEAAHVARRVRDFLEREAKRDLAKAVRHYTGRLGVAAKRLTVRDTKSRWGSCSARGNLNFSWRLILAPPYVLDYLAAHEVAHLKEMNHSHRFWRLLTGLCPKTIEAERWLKRHGTELHRFG